MAPLGRDDRTSELQHASGVGGRAELGCAIEGIAQRDAMGDAIEPVAGREVYDRHGGLAEQMDRSRSNPDPAAQHELTHVAQTHPCELLTCLFDHEHFAALADHRPLLLDVERQGFIARWIEAAYRRMSRRRRVWGNVPEGEGLVR